ncbi:MAG: DUF2442 domain-containing protein [Verrucomicrobiota bacterium]
MSTLIAELRPVTAEKVRITNESLTVELTDGRILSVPLAWFPRLQHARAKERANWRWISKGEGIHWPDLDEDISMENLVLGQASGESQASFKRWLQQRK